MDAASSISRAQTKNACKKELKNERREEDRRRKEEEKAKLATAMPTSQVQKAGAADDEDMDPTQYQNRLKYVAAPKAEWKDPYPHKFPDPTSVVDYINRYGT